MSSEEASGWHVVNYDDSGPLKDGWVLEIEGRKKDWEDVLRVELQKSVKLVVNSGNLPETFNGKLRKIVETFQVRLNCRVWVCFVVYCETKTLKQNKKKKNEMQKTEI